MLETSYKSALSAYKNILTFALCVGLFLLLTYLFIGVLEPANKLNLLYILMVLQIAPALILFTRGDYNFISFIFLNHFFVYSLAKYNQLTHLQKSLNVGPYSIQAFTEMIYCTLLIFLSYHVTRLVLNRKKYVRDEFEFFYLSQRQYFWIGFICIMQPVLDSIVPAQIFTFHVVITGACIILLFCSKTDNQSMQRWVKGALLLSAYYSFLRTGSMSTMGSIGMISGIVFLLQSQMKKLFFVFIFGFSGVCIQTVKTEYRIITRESQNLNVVQQVGVLLDLLQWKYLEGETPEELAAYQDEITDETPEEEEARKTKANGESTDVKDNLAKGFSRVGDDSLERVLMMTPSQVPFWEGESYEHIPYIFIPRFLWPDKPVRDIWNKFGKTYGFLSENDFTTSVGVNFLGEGYMNFGYVGLYSVACLFGFLVGAMETFSFVFLGRFNYFTFICFMIPYMNYGLDLGSILNGTAFILTVLFLARYRLLGFVQKDIYSSI